MSDGPRQGSLYDLLGVAPNAPAEAIRAAITAQRRVWRRRTTAPDITARQEAERRMQALDDAERTLLDPVRRDAYDARLLAAGPIPSAPLDRPGPAGPPRSPAGGPFAGRGPAGQVGAGASVAGPPARAAAAGGPAAPAGAPADTVGPRGAGTAATPAGAAAQRTTATARPEPTGTRGRDTDDDRWLVRAVEQLGQQQYEVASFTARRAVEADPENDYAWSVLAEAAARAGDLPVATDAVERALRLDPESAALHAQRGWILERANDLGRAYSAYLSAARLAPQRPEYRVRAIQALLRAGKVDEAVADAEAAYQARPDDGEIRTALAAALAERAVAAQHELPDGQLVIASPSQASYVLALANRGLSVQPPDPAVVVDLERQRDYARRAMRRQFSLTALRRNYRWPVGLGLISLAVLCCTPTAFGQVGADGLGAFQTVFLLFAVAVLAAFVLAVAVTCFEPRHRRNARLIEHTVPRRKGRGPGEHPRTL